MSGSMVTFKHKTQVLSFGARHLQMPIQEKIIISTILSSGCLAALVGRFSFPFAQCKIECRMVPVLQCSLQPAPCTLQPATSQTNASASLAGRGCGSGGAQVGAPALDCVRQPAAVLHSRGPAAIGAVAELRAAFAAGIQVGVGASPPGRFGSPAAVRCGREPPPPPPPPRHPAPHLSRGSRTHMCRTEEPQWTVEPREPTTSSRGSRVNAARLIRSAATRRASGEGAHPPRNEPRVHTIFFLTTVVVDSCR